MTSPVERTDEQTALAATFGAFFERESSPERVRTAEPLGFDPALWSRVRELGVPELALGGTSLADLAVVAEEAGRALAPIPLVEAVVALRALERLGADDRGLDVDLCEGRTIATYAPRPVKQGVARLVPAGAIAHAVLALDGDELVYTRGAPPEDAPSNLASSPLADRSFGRERTVLAWGGRAHEVHAAALDEWRVLNAAALIGLSRGALALGVAYAKERRQFGVPIGAFQALQHRLADAATALDGAALLVAEAAAGGPCGSALAAAASWFAGQTTRDVAGFSLHVHGGYGFMLEQDIQLFFRRATGWVLALGDPDDGLLLAADALERVGWKLDSRAPSPFQREVREFVTRHCTEDVVELAHETGTMHDWRLHRALAEKGWLAADWPVSDGGQGRDPWEILELHEELARAGAPVHGWGTSNLVAHTLAIAGSETQRREIVPRILRGDALCCLGYSEPDAGSDVAAAATRAVRDGDDWIINGQKMFTTLAHESTYVFLLTRTNTEVAKHRGLTMFLVPLATEGIEITAIHTLGGERTNVTFYTDVRVPDSCRVGAVDAGWDVMGVALAFERNPTMVNELDRLLEEFVAWGDGRPGVLGRPSVRRRLTRAVIDLTIGRLFERRMTAVAIAR